MEMGTTNRRWLLNTYRTRRPSRTRTGDLTDEAEVLLTYREQLVAELSEVDGQLQRLMRLLAQTIRSVSPRSGSAPQRNAQGWMSSRDPEFTRSLQALYKPCVALGCASWPPLRRRSHVGMTRVASAHERQEVERCDASEVSLVCIWCLEPVVSGGTTGGFCVCAACRPIALQSVLARLAAGIERERG